MGLIANGFRDGGGLYWTSGATVSNNSYPSAQMANRARAGSLRNLTFGEGITTTKAGVPNGYRHPASWLMPMKAGALSTHNNLTGAGDFTDADAWAVKLAEAAISGDGSLTAFGGLIVQLIAAITGSGTVTNADVKAFLAAVADLSGSGDAAGTATGLGELIAALIGDGTLDSSILTGIGELDADLVVTGTGLSTANVAQAVWSALASANNEAGTMGEKLNSAGSGSSPVDIASAVLSAAQTTPIEANVKKINEVPVIGTGIVSDKWRA